MLRTSRLVLRKTSDIYLNRYPTMFLCRQLGSNSWTEKRPTLLEYSTLKFNSVDINVSNFDVDTGLGLFESQLEETLKDIRAKKCNAVFLSVPMSKSALIAPAGRLGFQYHHAEKDAAKLFMWLADTENKVPLYGTHSVGVGSVVMLAGTDQLLVVKEWPPFDANWKLPGGYADLGEDFSAASVREVVEETGVHSEFKSILGFRQTHNGQFGRSNLYVICLLEAAAARLQVDAEIQDARWMGLQEFRACTSHPMSHLIVDAVLQSRAGCSPAGGAVGGGRVSCGLKESRLTLGAAGSYKFYHV